MVDNNAFWSTFSDSSYFQETTCEGAGSLAVRVLNEYGIDTANEAGGDLKDIDIAHMDATEVIKMSLIEDSVDNNIAVTEMFVDYDTNSIRFREVGSFSGNVTDIYYTVQTTDYVEKCSGVMVTGKKPQTYRKSVGWSLIWGEGDNDTKRIYDTSAMYDNCGRTNMDTFATIVWRDPNLQSAFNDGIDNLYEIDDDNPWDVVSGFAFMKDADLASAKEGPSIRADISIAETKQSQIPLLVAGDEAGDTIPFLGKSLFKRPSVSDSNFNDPSCWMDQAQEAPHTHGIPVSIPDVFRFETKYGDKVDNYLGISKVYVEGIPLEYCQGRPVSPAAALKDEKTPNDMEIWAAVDSMESEVIELASEVDYIVAYDPSQKGTSGKTPYIVFASNAPANDVTLFGSGNNGEGVSLNIYPDSSYAINNELEDNELLNQGPFAILPTGKYSAVLVKKVWAVVSLEAPSLIINDPEGDALNIANNFHYYIRPLVTVNEPAPIGFNGTLVNQAQSKQDNDPTTRQDFSDTDYELALDTLDGGGGANYTFAFLNEEQVVSLSQVLFDYMNNGDGITTTYTCGPNCEPELGGYGPAGGIVNAIEYSYSDSGSYTISVHESGRLIDGLGSVTGGPTVKQTEDVSATGIVIQDAGNHVNFKVRVQGFGERYAINVSSDIIRIGDMVNVSIHNNPIEV